jgi:glycosyltransferase involved in cell wall biosynthesis
MLDSIIEQIQGDPVIFWLLTAFAASTLIQLIYFWGIFAKLSFYKEKRRNPDLPPVSVVITASNQYYDLKTNLEFFLQQEYPDFEVLVVIDNSDDQSAELLEELSRQYENLNIVELHQKLNWFSGRKFPLSLGIKSAMNDLILLSEPTCRPENNYWISEMVSAYLPNTEMVLGFSSFATKSGINKWLRFTAFYDALFYLSMALSGFPFKGIGRNLSYSRNLFYRNKGFSSHYVISYGDDELFVNKTATKKNTRIKISTNSRVIYNKKLSFVNWLATEKIRLRIRRSFKLHHRILIRGFSLTSFLFYGLLITALLFHAPWMVITAIFALRFISQIIVFGFAQKRLQEKKLLLLSPVFEILLILLDFLIWISLLFNRNKKWA